MKTVGVKSRKEMRVLHCSHETKFMVTATTAQPGLRHPVYWQQKNLADSTVARKDFVITDLDI